MSPLLANYGVLGVRLGTAVSWHHLNLTDWDVVEKKILTGPLIFFPTYGTLNISFIRVLL